MKNSLNSILLYNFQNFTHMVSFNPIVWIFWSKLFLNVQLKWLKEKILYQSKNHLSCYPHSIFLPAIISYLLKSDLSLFCFKPSFLWFPLLLGKSSNALTGLPRFPMIWRFSLPLPHSPHQPHREVKESWLRAWTLEIEHLAVVPGSSCSISVTLSKLLNLFVPQFSHLHFEIITEPTS